MLAIGYSCQPVDTGIVPQVVFQPNFGLVFEIDFHHRVTDLNGHPLGQYGGVRPAVVDIDAIGGTVVHNPDDPIGPIYDGVNA